ncbi:NUDIX hydrolase domain-like protein [Suillus bovinus]|uniref:NUDIX hydrolase domain-like protein n=1 Tax=Suillus bovinus TaxID=48563 RepID=UPI001B87FEAC|nr:NUDIX hydrolase domain-like protein [Suillus bovinus]KAG2159308.1 NUDIX hydrolase domain-like protein [Suillus bovinus]
MSNDPPSPVSPPLSYLELVKICDNFRLPSDFDFPHVFQKPLDRDSFVPWTLSQSPGSPAVGLLRLDIVDLLRKEKPGTWVIPEPQAGCRVSFDASVNTPRKRSAVLKELCERWRDTGVFPASIGPRKWRNEMYPVYRNPFGELGNYAFEMERAACPLFGVITYGIHMTIYQGIASSPEVKIWVPTRAKTKQTWPSWLDNSVAGGIPSGMSVFESLVKECEEEASIEADIVRNHAKPVGAISYFFRYVYDLEVPNDTPFQPRPLDGEVESFDLLSLDEVKAKMRQGIFKPNCAAVLIDFFVRHGHLTPDDEPDYMEIITRLHGRFEYERWCQQV